MENKTNNQEEDIKFIDEINDTLWYQRGTAPVGFNPITQSEIALEKARSINYLYGIGRCHLSMGMGAFIIQHNFELSIKRLNEALSIFKDLENKKWIANTLLTLGIVNNSNGKPEAALYNASKGLEFYETNTEDYRDTLMAYYVIGTVYKDLKKYDEAEKYYKQGLQYGIENESWGGRIYTGLSNIYNDRGEYEQALELGIKSLEILKLEKNIIGESRALTDIGVIYKKLKKYDNALDYLFQGLKLREEANVKLFILGSLLEIAEVHKECSNKKEAIACFLKAEVIALETKHQVRLANIYQNIATLYKLTNDYIQSLEYYEKFIQLTLELNKKETETKITNLQNSLIHEKEQEIERLKNVELKNAYILISEKNKEITDSIRYAKRIQIALITSEMYIEKNLNRLMKN